MEQSLKRGQREALPRPWYVGTYVYYEPLERTCAAYEGKLTFSVSRQKQTREQPPQYSIRDRPAGWARRRKVLGILAWSRPRRSSSESVTPVVVVEPYRWLDGVASEAVGDVA